MIAEQERESTTEGEKTDPPADELEDGEIDDDEEEEVEEEELTGRPKYYRMQNDGLKKSG